jgi:hypothetical protein
MADVWDPLPESATEARLAEELRLRLQEERTHDVIREAEIRAKWKAEDAARREEELRGAAWELRERMLAHLRDTLLRADTKVNWRMRLEQNPTSADLARLQADVGAFHGSGGLMPEVMLREFLVSFGAEVDQLRQLVLRYEQEFS